jgi:hypothetical protein
VKEKEKEKLLNERLLSKASVWYQISLELGPALADPRKNKNDWMYTKVQEKVI